MESEYLTTAEVAEMFRVTPTTVTRWCNQGKYPRKYLMRTNGNAKGSKWLIHRDALKPKASYKQIRSSTSAQEAINRVYELLEQV
mgnify:CR=1 FL=1